MKKIFHYILLALPVLAGTSCNKWLDVKPSNQINDEELFKDADGVRIALNGIYQNLGDAELYGRQLTWGLNSVIGQDYTTASIGAEYQKAMALNFTDPAAAPGISKTWATAYTTIANINKLIKVVDQKDTAFFPLRAVEKNLIMGEALAVRAILHFELLRLFAPAPVNDKAGRYMPYQTEYPAPITPPSSTDEVLQHIIADLVQAQSLVAQNDTVTNKSAMSGKLGSLLLGSGTSSGGIFFSYRMNRMNYVAIHALLARVYMYSGDRVNAKKEAEYLYKEFGPSGRLKWWAFTTEANSKGANRYTKLADDLILGFYDPNLVLNIKNYRNLTPPLTFILGDTLNWFPSNVRDYRTNLVENGASVKWIESTGTGTYVPQQNQLLPVLRFSEMYFIYSECLYEEGNTTDALKIFNELRLARGKVTTFSDATRTGFYNEFMLEYRREFIAEGQTVFAHKRMNRNIQVGSKVVPMDNKFVLPLPDGEKNF